MSDPFRLRVLKALTEALKGISPVNGYQSDLSDFTEDDGLVTPRVYRGRDRFGEGDPLPLISILEDFRPDESKSGSEGKTPTMTKWKLLIQGFVQDDPLNPTDPAYTLSADVLRCLMLLRKEKYDILGFGAKMPCITDIQLDNPVVRPPDNEISSVAFFFIGVTLTLIESTENPFA